ncbi:retrovirus-related pol polyprotein from transposon TNT 1-94 [Tanacetum coccineum]
MSGTVPPIPPPLGTNTGNPSSPNRVDTIPTDNTNNTTTNNVAQNVVDENLPQLLDSRGGSHVTNVLEFDKEDFTSWKVRFLVYLDGLEHYLLKILEDGPFVPMSSLSTSTNHLPKPQKQWSHADRRLANQDKRLKSIIISCLPNDVMKSVIKCKTAKAMWNDLILAHEGPSDTRDTKIAALRLKFNAFKALEGEKVNGTYTRLKCLLNDLENNRVTIPSPEVNATFVNSLPRKWLSMNQTQRANNSIKNDSLATLFCKYNYKEDSDSDVEEDLRSSSEFIADLNAEYHERAMLTNQKRFYKRSGRVGSARKPMDKSNEICFACGKQGHFQKELSFDDERVTKVKAFMAIAEDGLSIGKADARSGQWVEITMKKVQRLLSMTDDDERKHVLDYTRVDLHYVEDESKNLLNNFNILNQELVNLENESLKDEISDLKKVIEKWTCSKVILDQLLSKQLPGNIVQALGGRGKRKEKISSKEVIFTKANESSSEPAPKITYESESECDTQEPLPPLPKLIGAKPSGTSCSLLSLADLTLNMVDLTLNTTVPKKAIQTSDKVSLAYVIKKKT